MGENYALISMHGNTNTKTKGVQKAIGNGHRVLNYLLAS